MIFVATLTHPPELCLANSSYKEEGKEWVQGIRESAKKLGVKVHGLHRAKRAHVLLRARI